MSCKLPAKGVEGFAWRLVPGLAMIRQSMEKSVNEANTFVLFIKLIRFIDKKFGCQSSRNFMDHYFSVFY